MPVPPGVRRVRAVAQSRDPFVHLAVEHLWLRTLPPDTCALYLWISDPAVIIGRNQNPWAECRPHWLADRGIHLARRITGGGAVYHDAGNLNYAIITDQRHYDRDRVLAFAIRALARLGVAASVGPRHILVLGDKKISGTAFYHSQGRVLHHGTLLVHADLRALEESLRPLPGRFSGPRTRSAPFSVCNLADALPGITTDACSDALTAAFGGDAVAPPDHGAPQMAETLDMLRSDPWRWAKCPSFTWEGPWRGVPTTVRVERGVVRHTTGPAAWVGRPFVEVARLLDAGAT